MQDTPMLWCRMVLKVLVPERAWRRGFWECCLPVFRLASASSSRNFFFFLKLESWGCTGTLGLVRSKRFSKYLSLLMMLEAENRFLLASASCLVCRGGTSGLASCAPLI